MTLHLAVCSNTGRLVIILCILAVLMVLFVCLYSCSKSLGVGGASGCGLSSDAHTHGVVISVAHMQQALDQLRLSHCDAIGAPKVRQLFCLKYYIVCACNHTHPPSQHNINITFDSYSMAQCVPLSILNVCAHRSLTTFTHLRLCPPSHCCILV